RNSGMSPDRRTFLARAAALAMTPGVALSADRYAGSPWRKLSDADWKKRLSPAAFDVLRREGTEAPGSSPLLKEHRKGTFACAGCGLALFKSDWKFESGTGWPSFYTTIPGALATRTDHKLILPRTEYHCAQCLGHQGHVFDDGPRPTGLRYCNDGVALKFAPA
ncbi:MAG: methionine sulfoxide reductase, partial [Phenylobacterium sp.]|nr:methionine sulfoxide reductase [Phenylobacterium sp.]